MRLLPTILCFLSVIALWIAVAVFYGIPSSGLIVHKDPDWSYLLNALAMNTGDAPGQVDHPGITVHLIAGTCLRAWHALAFASQPIVDSVLLAPENYLAALGFAAALLAALSLALFSASLLGTIGWAGVAAFQLLLVVSPEVALNIRRMNPEGVLLFVVPLVLLAVQKRRWPAFAAAAGLAVAAKIVALPLLAFFAVWRKRIWLPGLLLALVSFLLATSSAHSQWRNSFNFYKLLLSHQGNYGAGEAGFFGFNSALVNLGGIWGRDNTAFLLFFIVGISLFLGLPKRNKTRSFDRGDLKLDLFTLLAALVGFLMVAKHGVGDVYPGSRYLLPVTLALAWRAAAFIARYRERAPILISHVLIIVCFSQVNRLLPLLAERAAMAGGFADRHLKLERVLSEHKNCKALFDNSYWSRPVGFYSAFHYTLQQYELDYKRLYPGHLFLDSAAPRLREIRGAYHIPQELVSGLFEEGNCFVVAGVPEKERASGAFFGKAKGRELLPEVFLYASPAAPSTHSPSSSRANP